MVSNYDTLKNNGVENHYFEEAFKIKSQSIACAVSNLAFKEFSDRIQPNKKLELLKILIMEDNYIYCWLRKNNFYTYWSHLYLRANDPSYAKNYKNFKGFESY